MDSDDLFGNIDQVKLDQPCKRERLIDIWVYIPLAPYLDLDEVEIEDVKEEHSSPNVSKANNGS